MFANMENFTFDRTSRPTQQQPRQERERTRSISPCSSAAMAATIPDSRFTLTDLAAQFANQRLRRDAQICYDSCETYANPDDDAGWQIEVDDAEEDDNDSLDSSSSISSCPIVALPLTRRRTCPSRPHSPTQRMQRQANARLLCSTTHHRDIAQLVSNMVKSQDQCSIISPSTLSLSLITSRTTDDNEDALEDDEGYDSGGGSASTSRRTSMTTRSSSSTSLSNMTLAGYSRPRSGLYRRASDRRHASGASVCKSARFRRDTRVSNSRQ